MKLLILSLVLIPCLCHAAPKAKKLTEPKCTVYASKELKNGQRLMAKLKSNEDCLNAWYAYGDQSGDYGPIDSAEDYLDTLTAEMRECITEDAPKKSDGKNAERLYAERAARCVLKARSK